ncbi:MAG: cytochrome c oxidase assembly protein [Candidatus Bathyarchaeia archaeon]
MNRIVPLGLTQNEARGWYLRAVLMPWLLRGVIAISVASTMILSMLTTLSTYLESTLILHMVAEPFIYVAAGFLLAYGLHSLLFVASPFHKKIKEIYRRLLNANSVFNRWGVFTFIIVCLLTAYWYLPVNFDAAVLNGLAHYEMHITLLVAGALVYGGSRGLTKGARRIAPIIVGKALGLYGVILLLTPTNIYSVYAASEQAEAGVVMVVLMLVLDLTVLPLWLYNYFGRGPVSLERQP